MDSTLTYNTVAFSKSYDNEMGSKRQSNARGISTPDVLSVKHMDIVDNETKVAGRRHTVRFDQYQLDSESAPYKNDVYLVVDVSSKATTAEINLLIADLRSAIANTTAGQDILAGVLNNES